MLRSNIKIAIAGFAVLTWSICYLPALVVARPIFAGGFGFSPIVYDKPVKGEATYRTGPTVDLYMGQIASSSLDLGLRVNATGYQLDSNNPGARGYAGPTLSWSLSDSDNSMFVTAGAGSFFVHQAGNSHYRFGGGAILAAGVHLSPTLTVSFGSSGGQVKGASLAYAFAIIEWLKF